MAKKVLALFLAVWLCFGMAGCGAEPPASEPQTSTVLPTTAPLTTEPSAPPETEPTLNTELGEEPEPAWDGATPLLYKATDEDGSCIWLFGSIHVGREDFYPLPDYVLEAYRLSDGLAVELDVLAFEKNLLAQAQALKTMIYTDGTKISDHISAELYAQTVTILKENHLYSKQMDAYLPAMWSMLVDNALFEQLHIRSDLGIDRHLLEMAKEDEKPVVEVESAQSQYEMLAGFSEQLQILMLESALLSYEDPQTAEADMAELIELWYTGDEAGLTASLATQGTSTTDEEARLLLEYNQAMFTERNLAMAAFAETALAEDSQLFICVGAGHIVGEGAMADLLRHRGYTVEAVH